MTYLEVDNYLMLAATVLYVAVAPNGIKIQNSIDLISEDGMLDMYETFIELGFHESEINFKRLLLTENLVSQLKQLQEGW